MSKRGHNIFAMIVNFLSTNYEPKYIIIVAIEAHDMNGIAMAMKLKQIIGKFSFTQKILVYVKGEGSNLETCAQVFKSVVSCGDFGITL